MGDICRNSTMKSSECYHRSGKTILYKNSKQHCQMQTKKKEIVKNIVSFQKTSGKSTFKTSQIRKITDAQIKLIFHGIKFTLVNKVNKKNPKAIIAGF